MLNVLVVFLHACYRYSYNYSRENMIENQGFVPTSQLISFVLNNTDAKLRPDVDGEQILSNTVQ